MACIGAAALCLIALANLPYGYYTLLRLVVCAAAVLAGIQMIERGWPRWSLLAWGLALLYNPIVRITLEREVWESVNIGTAVVLAAGAWVLRTRLDPSPTPDTSVPSHQSREPDTQTSASTGNELDELDDDLDEWDDDEDAPAAASTMPAPISPELAAVVKAAEDRLRAHFEGKADEEIIAPTSAVAEMSAEERLALDRKESLERAVRELQAKIDAIGEKKGATP